MPDSLARLGRRLSGISHNHPKIAADRANLRLQSGTMIRHLNLLFRMNSNQMVNQMKRAHLN